VIFFQSATFSSFHAGSSFSIVTGFLMIWWNEKWFYALGKSFQIAFYVEET
jgi:hypothetical protein